MSWVRFPLVPNWCHSSVGRIIVYILNVDSVKIKQQSLEFKAKNSNLILSKAETLKLKDKSFTKSLRNVFGLIANAVGFNTRLINGGN